MKATEGKCHSTKLHLLQYLRPFILTISNVFKTEKFVDHHPTTYNTIMRSDPRA